MRCSLLQVKCEMEAENLARTGTPLLPFPCCRFDGALVMSRCNACNAAAFELVQPREAARSLVPARVFEVGHA